MTFKDFTKECEMFEHSSEYWDMCKECSEIELTEQYINNQLIQRDYLAETGIIPLEERAQLTEGFFAEAATDDQLLTLMEEVEQKKEKWYKRIWNWIKDKIAKFAKWLHKCATGTELVTKAEYDALMAKMNSNDEEAKKQISELGARCRELYENHNILIASHNEKIATINNMKEEMKKKDKEHEDAMKAADAKHKEEMDDMTRKRDSMHGRFVDAQNRADKFQSEYLALAGDFSAYKNIVEGKTSQAVSPNVIADIFADIEKGLNKIKDGDSAAVKSLMSSANKRLDKSVSHAAKHVIKMPTGKAAEEVAKELDKILQALKDNEAEMNDPEAKKEMFDAGMDPGVLSEIRTLTVKMSKVIADTMKLMDDFNKCSAQAASMTRSTLKKLQNAS